MFNKVLVGFDGSERAQDALALGVSLRAPDGELVVCSVHHLDTLSAKLDPEEPRLSRADAESCELLASELTKGSRRVDTMLAGGASVADTLSRAATERRADLLVLGSSHRGALGRVLIGSVSEETLHGAPCAAAIAPAGYCARAKDARISQIAVGYDPGAKDEDALLSAANIALQSGGQLLIVAVSDTSHAVAVGASGAMAYEAILKAQRRGAEESVRQALTRLPAGAIASSEVCEGPAAVRLLEISRNVDLLVLGSRRHGPVRRLMLGSVCDAVVREAACPVLVIGSGPSGQKPTSTRGLSTEVSGSTRA